MWAAWHQAHQPAAPHEAAVDEILHLPTGHLLDPVRQLGGPFRRTCGAARFEDQRDRCRASVTAWDQVVDGSIAKLMQKVGKPAEVVEGFDIGLWVEVQCLRRPQPERAAGVLPEVPRHRGAQICDRILDRMLAWNVQQREVESGHGVDPVTIEWPVMALIL